MLELGSEERFLLLEISCVTNQILKQLIKWVEVTGERRQAPRREGKSKLRGSREMWMSFGNSVKRKLLKNLSNVLAVSHF